MLRRAAAEMRRRAAAAGPPAGPWSTFKWIVQQEGAGDVASTWPDTSGQTAEYIASMHPGVALAVADLLEQHARVREFAEERGYVLSAERAATAEVLASVHLGEAESTVENRNCGEESR
jgi:hypothetical protein